MGTNDSEETVAAVSGFGADVVASGDGADNSDTYDAIEPLKQLKPHLRLVSVVVRS
jgi:hypothetical protein